MMIIVLKVYSDIHDDHTVVPCIVYTLISMMITLLYSMISMMNMLLNFVFHDINDEHVVKLRIP